jgi:hypothetical protein
MFFGEKIERLKQKFSTDDFKVPFTEGTSILKSIERKFITVKDLADDLNNLRQYRSNWADNIKHKIEIRSIDLDDYHSWLEKLDPNMNYWAVIAFRNSPSAKHYVYDCKPNALIVLISIARSDFFLVDKKYNWFSYFNVNEQTKTATIFKSGDAIIPFEA